VHIATTLKYVFDLKEEDRYWCAADPGWITGHSYIVYAPLILGATSFMYEGAPGYPYPDRWWQLIEKYNITILYTAPTAIRSLMRFGEEWTNRHDLSSLRLLGSVGEPINPEAWRWYHTHIGKERCPIMDTWWQTETGGFMITPTPVVPLKPGSGTLPFAGIQADVVREDGVSADANEDGYLVIKHPWPGMARTVWGDPDRYRDLLGEFAEQGWYFTGDSARRDEDGYFWIIGRMDDVIKVSAATAWARPRWRARWSATGTVAEAAGDRRAGRTEGPRDPRLLHPQQRRGRQRGAGASELKDHVRHEVGPIAMPGQDRVCGQPAQDPQRQDHAPLCSRRRCNGRSRLAIQARSSPGR
jgi:acetyl-CoA synthetase